jgi:hypothetical protein
VPKRAPIEMNTAENPRTNRIEPASIRPRLAFSRSAPESPVAYDR